MNETLKNRQDTAENTHVRSSGRKRTIKQSMERIATQRRLLRKRKEWGYEGDESVLNICSENTEDANLLETSVRKADRIQRRWKHVRKEQKARRFPESNRLLLQLLFLASGLIPMFANRVKESARNRHQKAVRRAGGLGAWADRRWSHPVLFLGVTGLAACAVVAVSTYTVGTTVTYDGRVLAKVASKEEATEALANFEKITSKALGSEFVLSESLIQYSDGIMPREEVEDSAVLQQGLSDSVGLVTYGYSLYVGGELIGATPYEGALEELIQQLINAVSTENTVSCTFQEDVQIVEGYVANEDIKNLGNIAELLYSTKTEEVTYTVQKGDTWSQIAQKNGLTSNELLALNPGYNINKLSIGEELTMSAAVPYLTITVTERERYVEEVPFEIEYTDTANLYVGDYDVISAGVYGTADVVANVTYINGEEVERAILSSVTLTEPVTEKQLRGTTPRPTWHASGKFRWPVSGRVSSKFGPRKSPGGIGSTNHKGIDIANKKGTAIYAADGGKVVYAGWSSGYGYLVKIDHQNGYVTYYAHCSKLLVKVGDKVPKGTKIALVGSTGTATGNCCHFEVRYKGVAKNPLNYLP